MSVHGDNTTPISNHGVAGPGPMVCLETDLKHTVETLFGMVGLTVKRLLRRPYQHYCGPCNPELG